MLDVQDIPTKIVLKKIDSNKEISPTSNEEMKSQKKIGEVPFETPHQKMQQKPRIVRHGSERHLLKSSLPPAEPIRLLRRQPAPKNPLVESGKGRLETVKSINMNNSFSSSSEQDDVEDSPQFKGEVELKEGPSFPEPSLPLNFLDVPKMRNQIHRQSIKGSHSRRGPINRKLRN